MLGCCGNQTRVTLTPGTRLGPYQVLGPLGSGGMGEVYRALDTRLDRSVAIKVLAASFASDAAFQQRLHTEARAISKLSHPHICTLYDVGEHNGSTFLVMELIEGETLADRLRRLPAHTLPVDETLRLGIQIAEALAVAHRRGIIHRDLKPGNVMLAKGAGPVNAKLLDFGLAKVQAPLGPVVSNLETTPPQALTAEGTVLGTYQYHVTRAGRGRRGGCTVRYLRLRVRFVRNARGQAGIRGQKPRECDGRNSRA